MKRFVFSFHCFNGRWASIAGHRSRAVFAVSWFGDVLFVHGGWAAKLHEHIFKGQQTKRHQHTPQRHPRCPRHVGICARLCLVQLRACVGQMFAMSVFPGGRCNVLFVFAFGFKWCVFVLFAGAFGVKGQGA